MAMAAMDVDSIVEWCDGVTIGSQNGDLKIRENMCLLQRIPRLSGCPQLKETPTMWRPQTLAKLVRITPTTIWFMVLLPMFTGLCKPTCRWMYMGGPHCRQSICADWFEGHLEGPPCTPSQNP